jgi:hypothetical protein
MKRKVKERGRAGEERGRGREVGQVKREGG